MEPAFKGLYDFPASACISVNEQLVHGIPSKKVILNEGDIVSVDTGTIYKGYNSDAARTYGVGSIDGEARGRCRKAARPGSAGGPRRSQSTRSAGRSPGVIEIGRASCRERV